MLPLLIGAGLLLGGILIVANWEAIVDWLNDFIPKLRKVWDSVKIFVPHAAAVFGDVVLDGAERMARIMHKLYYKENNEWIEETTTRKVDESEVPEFIRNKIKQQEADITSEIEEHLSLEV